MAHVAQVLSNQPRPAPPKFGKIRANFGQHRTKVIRNRKTSGDLVQTRPKFDQYRAEFGRHRPIEAESRPTFSNTLPNLAESGPHRPSSARTGPTLADIVPMWPNLGQSWPKSGEQLPHFWGRVRPISGTVDQLWGDVDRIRAEPAKPRASLTNSGRARAILERNRRTSGSVGQICPTYGACDTSEEDMHLSKNVPRQER